MAWDVREREISEEQSKEVKGELINMTHTWDKEESESPTGMEPMPMTSRTHGGHSIHEIRELMESKVILSEFICGRRPAFCKEVF